MDLFVSEKGSNCNYKHIYNKKTLLFISLKYFISYFFMILSIPLSSFRELREQCNISFVSFLRFKANIQKNISYRKKDFLYKLFIFVTKILSL